MKKLFFKFFPIILSFGFISNLSSAQLTRSQIVADAEAYLNLTWTAYPNNCLANGYYCSSIGRTVYKAPWVVVGSNTSMPYCWGGWSTAYQHTSQMTTSTNTQAGDVCSISGGGCSGFSSAPLSCASGHDCSGLISRVWGLSSKYSTSTLPGISTAIDISSSQAGDILNDAGSHVRLVETNYGNGNYRVIEASGTDWKVAYHTYNVNQLTGYDPRCWNNVIGGCAVAQVPSNDNCSGATTLTSNLSCVNTSGTVSAATASGLSKPTCDAFASPTMLDVWYKFTAVSTSHTITVTPSPSFDAVVALYTSCSGGQIGCADVGGGLGGVETINATSLTVGNIYYIRVYDYGSTAPTTPTFNICVTHSSPLACTVSIPSGSSVSENSGSKTFNVSSNGTSSWTVSESCNWLSCSPTSGTGNGTVTITYSANGTSSSRDCDITVSCGSVSEVYTLTQDAPPPPDCTISIPSGNNVSSTAGSTTFNITSNGSDTWTVSESCNWLSCSPTSGTGNGTVTITYSANPNTPVRTCDITVSCGSASNTYTLSQDGTTTTCNVSIPNGSTVNSPSGTTSFNITSNGVSGWTVSESCNWLSCSPTSGTGNGTVTITYSANPNPTVRTCDITVSCGSASETYTITQEGTTACTITMDSTTSVVYSPSGTLYFTFSVSNSSSWSVSESCNWVTCLPTSGSGNGLVVLSYQENPNTSIRSCIITVDCESSSKTYTLIQLGPVGINEFSQQIDLSVFPNPTKTNITILGRDLKDGDYEISLTNILGGEVYRASFIVVNGKLEKTIEIKDYVSGIYYLNIKSEKVNKTFKIEKL